MGKFRIRILVHAHSFERFVKTSRPLSLSPGFLPPLPPLPAPSTPAPHPSTPASRRPYPRPPVHPPPIIYLVTWIFNIDFLCTGNQQINANMVKSRLKDCPNPIFELMKYIDTFPRWRSRKLSLPFGLLLMKLRKIYACQTMKTRIWTCKIQTIIHMHILTCIK